jgi:hypothetical protein
MKRSEIRQYLKDNKHLSLEELSAATGISKHAVSARFYRMGVQWEGPPLSVSRPIEEKVKENVHRKRRREAERDNRELLDRVHALELELAGMYALKEDTKHHKIDIAPSSGKTQCVAVALLSDTHYEEEVIASSVNMRNKYNLTIAKQRNDEFFQRVVKLIRKERQQVQIDTLVLGILGDLITGNIHESVSMDSCLLGPMDATIFAQEMVRSGIMFIREQEPKLKITVVCKFGNHSRSTSRVHIGNEGAYATEKLIYCNLRDRFSDDDMIEFVIEDSHLTYVNIAGLRVRLCHGHFVRFGGGVGGLTIPLNKAIAGWDDEHETASFTLLGHFHQYTPLRRVVVNGSMIGFNTFGVSIKAKWEPAIQSFFLVDAKRKEKTVHIPIIFSV